MFVMEMTVATLVATEEGTTEEGMVVVTMAGMEAGTTEGEEGVVATTEVSVEGTMGEMATVEEMAVTTGVGLVVEEGPMAGVASGTATTVVQTAMATMEAMVMAEAVMVITGDLATETPGLVRSLSIRFVLTLTCLFNRMFVRQLLQKQLRLFSI